MDVKNQEAFHWQVSKMEGVLRGVFVFQMCPSNDALYRRILSYITRTECKYLVGTRNAWCDSEKVHLQRHLLSIHVLRINI